MTTPAPWEMQLSPTLDENRPNAPGPGVEAGLPPWQIDLERNRTQQRINTTRQRSQARNEYYRTTPPLNRIEARGRLIARGIPAIGRAIPHSETSRQLAAVDPAEETAASFIGGIGPFGVASRILSGVRLPRALGGSRIGSRFATEAPAQAALGGAASTADSYASGGRGAQNVVAGGIGAAGGFMGPLFNRGAFPGGTRFSSRAPEPAPSLPPMSNRPVDELTNELNAISSNIERQIPYNSPGDQLAGRFRSDRGIPQRIAGATPENEATASSMLDNVVQSSRDQNTVSRVAPIVSEWAPRFAGGAAGHFANGDLSGLLAGMAVGDITNRAVRRWLQTPAGKRYMAKTNTPRGSALINSIPLSASTLGNDQALPLPPILGQR